MLIVISIFHFNPILTPFLNYGLNATQNLYMFAVELGGLFFLHILDMFTGTRFKTLNSRTVSGAPRHSV